jgi:peptidoglycan/LPS O-acetylase OafA/YrhL
MSRSSIALSNLRAVVILIVLAFHSVLAYLASLPATSFGFDDPPYRWQATPIIDTQRWFGFDLFCAWQDVSLMSLMFFLSGVFVPSSLARKGGRTFLSDRFLRIGVPLVLVVALLMPIAYYPSYAVAAVDPSAGAFWQHWRALPFWPCGPQWFLWQLLALNVLAVVVHRLAPGWHESLKGVALAARDRPAWFFAALVAVSALAYVPLALIHSPWTWTNYGPVSFQLSRPLHYLVYFFAGMAVGAQGLDRGLLAADGALARNWAKWLAAAVAGFVLWAGPTSLTMGGGPAPFGMPLASALGFVIACAGGCFFLLAVCLRFATERVRALDSLSANAYSMYLLHYVFIVWLQYAVLSVDLPAIGKAAIVFGGTLAMSWGGAVAFGGVPFGTYAAQLKRWLTPASFSNPAPAKLLNRDDRTG